MTPQKTTPAAPAPAKAKAPAAATSNSHKKRESTGKHGPAKKHKNGADSDAGGETEKQPSSKEKDKEKRGSKHKSKRSKTSARLTIPSLPLLSFSVAGSVLSGGENQMTFEAVNRAPGTTVSCAVGQTVLWRKTLNATATALAG